MGGLREKVGGLDMGEAVKAIFAEAFEVAGEGGGVATHIDDAGGVLLAQGF